MRSAIYGAGSLGTILGAYLARDGVDIDLVSRNRAHIEALRRNGAHVTGMVDFSIPVSAMTPEEMDKDYDVIILMTKCIDNENTIRFLSEHLSSRGIICTCQNGLPEVEIASIIGNDRTYGCTIGWGASYVAPGISELTSSKDTFTFALGRIGGGSDDNLRSLCNLFSHMGKAEIDKDFAASRWSKLLINASFSAVSAICGTTFGEAAADRRSRRVIQLIMKECVDTAHAEGITLAPMQGKNIEMLADYHSGVKRFLCFQIIPFAMRRHRNLKSSMLQDIEKGRETEIDAIDGALVAEGRKAGVPTPVTERTVEIMHMISEGKLKPSMENLSLY